MMSSARYVRLPLLRPQTPTRVLKIPWGLAIELINSANKNKRDTNTIVFLGPRNWLTIWDDKTANDKPAPKHRIQSFGRFIGSMNEGMTTIVVIAAV
jgi:hypothetical protein